MSSRVGPVFPYVDTAWLDVYRDIYSDIYSEQVVTTTVARLPGTDPPGLLPDVDATTGTVTGTEIVVTVPGDLLDESDGGSLELADETGLGGVADEAATDLALEDAPADTAGDVIWDEAGQPVEDEIPAASTAEVVTTVLPPPPPSWPRFDTWPVTPPAGVTRLPASSPR